jgi:hypothetical protein
LSKSGQGMGLLLGESLDDERSVAGCGVICIGLALHKSTHGRDVILGRRPSLVELITRPRKVVVGVVERDFLFIWTGADGQGHAIDGVVGIGVVVAVLNVAQIVNVRVEVPVPGNVVEGMILHHEVHDMLDLDIDDGGLALWGTRLGGT